MKKLITIICALSLVMLFTLPAMADQHGGGLDVGLDETQVGLNAFSAQANAGDDAVANDGVMFDDYNKTVTVDKSYSKNIDINKTYDKDIDDSFNTCVDVDVEKTTTVTITHDESINLNNSDAAIAYGGGQDGPPPVMPVGIDSIQPNNNGHHGGMAVRMDDLELSFSSTNAWSMVGQSNGISEGGYHDGVVLVGLESQHGPQGGNDAPGIEVEAEDLCMGIDFTNNIGLGAGTFTQGNFVNANALNNVTMSVQW